MRWMDPRHAWGVLLLACAALAGTGCKKDQPVEAAAPVDAGVVAVATVDAGLPRGDAGTAAPGVKPLRFSNVVIRRATPYVRVTYTLTNLGTAQGRGEACLTLIDEHGLSVGVQRLGGITVKGGLTDTFEDRVYVTDLSWDQTHFVMLHTMPYDSSCNASIQQATSEPLRVFPSGNPAPAVLAVPAALTASNPKDFELSNARVSQKGGSDEYTVTYTVKNVTDHRAAGTGCLRAHWTESPRDLEEVPVGDFNLAPHASVTLTEAVSFDDDQHWDTVKSLRVFASAYGCIDKPDPQNVGFLFDKPAEVRAPVEQEAAEPEATEDASDDAAPEDDAALSGDAAEESID